MEVYEGHTVHSKAERCRRENSGEADITDGPSPGGCFQNFDDIGGIKKWPETATEVTESSYTTTTGRLLPESGRRGLH